MEAHPSWNASNKKDVDNIWRYGYLRQGMQLEVWLRAVRQRHVRRYCEIGVNGGHGTAAVLLGNPALTVRSFDLGRQTYSSHVYDLLRQSFPGRFEIFVGSSFGDPAGDEGAPDNGTLRPFIERVRLDEEPPCDVLLIDGAHDFAGVSKDLELARGLVPCGPHTLLFDDTHNGKGKDGVRRALQAAQGRGLIEVDKAWTYNKTDRFNNPCLRVAYPNCYGRRPTRDRVATSLCKICKVPWGFAVGHYVLPERCGAQSSPLARLALDLPIGRA